MQTEIDETTLALSVSEEHREAVLRAIEFERNPDEQTALYVCEVMPELYAIKQNFKMQESIHKRLDEIIKFAIRKNADNENTKQFFDVKKPLHVGKITNPIEMLSRLMQIFDDPMDFSSCVEFNFKNLKDLMGDDFIKDNSDIIDERDYAPAVYTK